ncbi:SIMPL domain-containing protein [Nakamurella lactea]|uniref:SIMPL domain-containing protein n=1 Tax=Nakamurella lactea TaxID=459515 RepID=UPI0004020523|nr:SIMPL domain-containing protein [Nakamurella lactea]
MTNKHQHRQGVTVIGAGSAAATVDEVTINLGVEILRPDAGEAFRTAAATVSSLLSVLADNGVDARSVRTADLNLGPRTDYREGHEVLLGYAASQRMIVHLEALGNVERILSEVAARGGAGVRIDSVVLSAGNPEQAYRVARDAAFAAAAEKAQQYAGLAGRTLGAVQEISENPMQHAVPMAAGLMRSIQSADSMAVSTGDTEVTATVQVRWGFADGADKPRPV